MIRRLRAFVRTRDGKRLAVIAGLGFVARIVWAMWAQRHVPITWVTSGDQYGYWYYGNELAHGRGYVSYLDGTATSYYPVGYPALLAVVDWIGLHVPLVPNDQVLLTNLAHSLLGAASIVLVCFIARKVVGNRAGLVAAAIVAFFPSMVIGVATFAVETTFVFAALACVAILVDHDWALGPPGRRRLLWFGAAFGAAVLVRPFIAPILIGLAIAAWIAGGGWRPALRTVGWVLPTLIVVLTPWTIRNEARFDAFVPISTNLGDTLCMARFPGSTGGFSFAGPPNCAETTLPEAERNTANTRAAARFVVDHPVEELRLVGRRFRLITEHDHFMLTEVLVNGSVELPSGVRRAVDFGADWYYHMVWILALPGLVLLCRGWRRDRLLGARRALVVVTAAGLLVIPIGLWGTPRFHAPLLPFLAIAAAGSVTWLTDRYRSA